MDGRLHSIKPTTGLADALRRTFRARQIYVRTEGDIRFFVISPTAQAVISVLGLGLLFWFAYATVNVAFKDQIIALNRKHLAEVKHAYESRLSEMRDAVEALNARLLLDQDAYLSKVDDLRLHYESLLSRQERLETYFFQGWQPTVPLGELATEAPAPPEELREEPHGQSGGKPTTEPESSQENSAPSQPARRDRTPVAKPNSKPKDQGSLRPGSMLDRYREPFETADEAMRPLTDIGDLSSSLDHRQGNFVTALERQVLDNITILKGSMKRMGLSPKLVERAQSPPENAIGGPFIPAPVTYPGDSMLARLEELEVQRGYGLELREAVLSLPIWLPLATSRVTSGFGLRRDPFRRRLALHSGIDLKSHYGAPVRATAAGIVMEAQWMAGYGKMVAIHHDKGLSTRYAHLSTISVVPGQRVVKGLIIGRLGNTGRSTGAHLHYETRVNGRAVDPKRFWQARNDLQKQEQAGQSRGQ
ncbi:M23 family metallopeptidase [Rhodoligotrophos ferricapiens]|uniref:M23 family metallopeptidase n=1 Tax=Rhodoligotrophos ferricapiens TaxID=3069264 RepID=UPI00315CC104